MLDRTNDRPATIAQGLTFCPAAAQIGLSSKKPGRRRTNHEAAAASSKRYRARFDAGQAVLSITTIHGRTRRMLIRRTDRAHRAAPQSTQKPRGD